MAINRFWLLPGMVSLNLLASWPHWRWMMQRAADGSDDPWGILALLTIALLVWLDKVQLRLPSTQTLTTAALLTIAASVSWGILPPLLATAFALLAQAGLLNGILPKPRPIMPLLMLALLALPLVASLNFYLGYPLRWICAQASAQVLSVFSLVVTPQGAALIWNAQPVLIDAPCAGIAMLWLGLYLAALFSYLNAASMLRFSINTGAAVVAVVLGNILRNTLLFFKEAGIVQLPYWTHEAIGLLLFGLLVPLIYFACALNYTSGNSHAIS